MLWLKAFHLISLVGWFAGLFYLPRLFVYHTTSQDDISIDRFKIMEARLYKIITTPMAILTTIFGFWLFALGYKTYLHQGWFHMKLLLIVILWAYHVYLGYLVSYVPIRHLTFRD